MEDQVQYAQQDFSTYVVDKSSPSSWRQSLTEGTNSLSLILDELSSRLLVLEANVSFLLTSQQTEHLQSSSSTTKQPSKPCKRQFKV